MIGTIVNTAAIIAGSLVGTCLKKGIRPQYTDVLYTAMGLAATGLGINAVVHNMPDSQYPVLFIVSLAVGGLAGTVIDIDGKFQRLVGKLQKEKSPAEGISDSLQNPAAEAAIVQNAATEAAGEHADAAVAAQSGRLGEGLSTGILLYCIGTLSILGPVQSALYGDHTYLFTNATLDLVTSAVLSSTYGAGMLLAAPVLFCWQGSIYLLTCLFGGFLSAEMMTELSLVGGFLIAASGLSILKIKEIKTLNLLPALLVPVVWILLIP